MGSGNTSSNNLEPTSSAVAALGMMASTIGSSNGGPIMHPGYHSGLDDTGLAPNITSGGGNVLGGLGSPLDLEPTVLAPMHANNNNNMVSPISPIHCGSSTAATTVAAELLPHAALAAASMASIEAMGFMDQSSSAKLEKGTSNGESSPKYISL